LAVKLLAVKLLAVKLLAVKLLAVKRGREESVIECARYGVNLC